MYKIFTTLASDIPEIWLTLQKFKIGHMTLTTPLSGAVCRPRLGLATPNLYAVFKVSISAVYEYIKGDAKRTKWGGLG